MKTQVSPTSIAVYHAPETQSMMATQFQRVAAYVVEQTRLGKPVCIGSIWQNFAKQETKGLGQTGTVSRVCNELAHADTIIVGGKEYRYERVAARKFNGKTVQHFCLVLNQKSPEEGVQQLNLF